jgi:hypothetical protein
MPILARTADVFADEAILTEFLVRNDIRRPDQNSFRWLYRDNPAGKARVWIAFESYTCAPVGMAGAFPRRMWIDGKEERGWVLGDFAIDSRYRSLGPAIQLQRACLQDLNALVPAVYYDFPSASMVAVYERLGIGTSHCMARLVLPLRVDVKVRKWTGDRTWSRAVSTLANAGLSLRNATVLRHKKLNATITHHCGSEFSELAFRLACPASICNLRTAEYLNWRYCNHPYRAYEVISLHGADSLLAYAIVTEVDNNLDLVDLFGESDAVPKLLLDVISMGIERKLQSVTASILADQLLLKVFANFGFRLRQKFPVVVSCPKIPESNLKKRTPGWFLMNGDRES